MRTLWCLFFLAYPVTLVTLCMVAPSYGWWFFSPPMSPLGAEIDNLFDMILWIVTITFVGTQAALCYTIWRFSRGDSRKGTFSHGSHNLEVLWTITPAAVLLFISLYQMDVWARYRVKKNFDKHAVLHPIAEVTARQFEWRIRYPAPSRVFKDQHEVENWLAFRQPDDLYTVNDLHIPTGRPVMIHLRTEDVQHSFFVPDLRIKQDALPGTVIPVWFEANASKTYELVCAELCGWGHYKMKGRIVADQDADFAAYLKDLHDKQFDDGVAAAQGEAEQTSGEEQ